MLKASKKVLYILFSLIVALWLDCNVLSARTIRTVEGTVAKVSDGDTLQLITPEQTKLKVRLYGIDAPETPKPKKPGQPFGNQSWQALKQKVQGRQVRLDILDIDRYRRMVSIVWIGNRNINLEMIKEGYAEAYREYLKPPFRSSFLSAEKEAQRGKRGVWSLPEYERPQDFRRRIFKKR